MLIKTTTPLSVIGVGMLTLVACGHPTTHTDANMATAAKGQAAATSGAVTSGAGDVDEMVIKDIKALQIANQSYYFDFNKSELHADAISSVKAQARYLMAHPDAKVLLAGHTDERGSREYNIALGQRRALSVAILLQAQGVGKDQIETVSYGAEKPVAPGHTEEDYAKNRRVDLLYQTSISRD